MRKTIDVSAVKDKVNAVLAAPNSTEDARRGVSFIVESVLMDTDNYRGFRYLRTELNEDGTLRDDYDDTRRYYF